MKLEIKNQSLFIEKAYINGQWVDADDNSTLDVLNPVNQEIIGRVPNCGATETNVAINAAAADGDEAEDIGEFRPLPNVDTIFC